MVKEGRKKRERGDAGERERGERVSNKSKFSAPKTDEMQLKSVECISFELQQQN